MAFLKATPQEDITAGIAQAAENGKQAVMWMAVIAVIVLLIVYGSKK